MKLTKEMIALITGLRKWSIMFLLLILSGGFRIADLINGAELVELLTGTVIAFFGANIGEHIVCAVKDKTGGK